jgi:hypothetical protein
MFNLKPCPFCNGNAIWNSRVVDGKGEYSISCIKCHIKTDWCPESDVDELREQWNSRVTDERYAKLVTENFHLKCDLDTRRILDNDKMSRIFNLQKQVAFYRDKVESLEKQLGLQKMNQEV